MARTSQQVFDDHQRAIEAGDFDLLMADYAEDAIMMTMEGPAVGKEAVRGLFEYLFTAFPNVKIEFEKTVVEDDLVLLQWSADSDVATIPHGFASFLIQDGLIRRQAEFFVAVPKEG